MLSKVPTIRQIAWISIIPQLIFMGLLTLVFFILNTKQPITFGATVYILLSIILRQLISKSHAKGIRHIKRGELELAIIQFKKSATFFSKYEWIDKYRYITLLSASLIRFKEMALCNIAYCYSQTNNGAKAKEYYELVLKEFPKSGIAITALNFINSLENSTK